jgi:phosphate transport system substrate-binding protein
MAKNLFIFLFSFIVSLTSCDDKKRLTDTPTSGKITIVVDENYKPIVDSEIMVFENHYPEAKINVIYKPSLEVVKAMDVDSVRMIITAGPVDTSYYKRYFQRKEYSPFNSFIAKDAVAIIANNSRKGLKITIEELAQICSGKITDFSQLEHGGGAGKITLVFDNPASSTVEYIQDSLLKGQALTSSAFAQKTNMEVMSYVQNSKNALGVIGVNWISDNQDEENLAFSKSIFPVEIRDAVNSQYYYPPHPGYVASHLYPMRRLMRATLKENGAGLGRGFLNFMTGEVGQRIVLKAGIVPANVVTRVVETRKDL